ncbi:elongation factor 4 [bacterium]|nr:elongation factor 4 [bacterium]|tara:strand:- start:914 stop:2707 length:1794 start_codon:yes stop_codon:yes gene_type:complete
MDTKNIRNFSIIAHIDHGKSTLADRMLEETHTIEKRKMKEQVLDSMELERERGITIKLAPVRMVYELQAASYQLNLIDTPGHIDFSYEVSRSLKAVEGAVLLVDATQGIQAQTITTLHMAQELGLVIIPAVSKIDSPRARTEEVKKEIAEFLNCSLGSIMGVSGKTGEGVDILLQEIVRHIPSPTSLDQKGLQALVFDFEYSPHRGIVVYTRAFNGEIKKGDQLIFSETKERFDVIEVGIFTPSEKPVDVLKSGEIGYIITGIKNFTQAVVGDTVTSFKNPLPALSGYQDPAPVVWASLYPESQDNFKDLKNALARLKLSDFSLSFNEEQSPTLGRGFRCGFLGMLHLEIITERLQREFGLLLVVTTPSIVYEILHKGTRQAEVIYSPSLFPDHGSYATAREPWVLIHIITPERYLGDIMQTLYNHEAIVGDSVSFGSGRIKIDAEMPLRELIRNFFDELKRVSSGFASFSYEQGDMKEADVVRLDVLVAEEIVPAFSQVIPRARIYDEAKKIVKRLHAVLPRQLFAVKIQARGLGKIISSETLSALKKNVTGHLYGGDITRKRKLWEKQKKGKKKLKERGKVDIPHDVFLKMIKND